MTTSPLRQCELFAAGLISREELIARLRDHDWRISLEPVTPGSFIEVELAHHRGLIGDDEYRELEAIAVA